jgi:4-hydroxy-tetrahydrodipicolinate reductase
MPNKTRVIVYGLGPIGSAVACLVEGRSNLELVGGVDILPSKVSQDLGQVIGLGRFLGITVKKTLADVLAKTEADVALHTTTSYFDLFQPQILELLAGGLDIVSTSEELSFPWLAHPDEAAEIDAAAKQAGKTVLGTGVNPGFLMDILPLHLTAICQEVKRIEVRRVINASRRRQGFQAKIGSGMSEEDFRARMGTGRMGHIGLPESAGMVFDTLGRKLVRYEDSIEPVIATKVIETPYFEVEPGQVAGLKQVARAFSEEGEFMTLTFLASLDAEDEGDTIIMTGVPTLTVTLKGTNGDLATTAMAVNAIRRVCEAPPGLVTMRDLPVVTI